MRQALEGKSKRLLRYSRLGSLSYMYLYDRDGISYRELKAALDLSDSQLGPQLLWLRKYKYAEVREEQSDNSGISVYYITQKGRDVYEQIMTWIAALPLGSEIKKIADDNIKEEDMRAGL